MIIIAQGKNVAEDKTKRATEVATVQKTGASHYTEMLSHFR